MAKGKLQYKYLNAGDKSTAVVLDASIDTCNEQTIYLYHQQRGEIVEFRRDIVEPKLRELSGDEVGMKRELEKGYKEARSG
ncbi:MAG: hypothetical protein OQK25_01145, partial [Gammaproteobacteria bacterium]|nr:hypothetical protein [Gammaproteobacteria bacterium]